VRETGAVKDAAVTETVCDVSHPASAEQPHHHHHRQRKASVAACRSVRSDLGHV